LFGKIGIYAITETIAIIIDSRTTVMFTFRFGTSDKFVHLNQQQLERIPYLFNLVSHKDDFLSVQNENDEYVLNYPIEYTSFIPILRSITSEQPYTLINEISEDDNVLDTLQLFDYFCINPFPLPLLENEDLLLSNPINNDNDKKRVEFREAIISEARQTAAEFIIALSKSQYNLNNSYTVEHIFSLIKVILSNAAVFSSRFRHHTLTVVKEYCYSFFSKKQQRILPTTQQIALHSKDESFMYLYDDNKLVPNNFYNTFARKGVYVLVEENHTDSLSADVKNTFYFDLSEAFYTIDDTMSDRSLYLSFEYHLINFRSVFSLYEDEKLPIYQNKQHQKNTEVQSARLGHFNTLPKWAKVDKFKHRSGPKVQKYR
jgi:hypothetical protein